MDVESENNQNHEKKTPVKFVSKSNQKKNVKNPEIEPDSETLTCNPREAVVFNN